MLTSADDGRTHFGWTGAEKDLNGGWKWTDGSPMSWTNWDPVQASDEALNSDGSGFKIFIYINGS